MGSELRQSWIVASAWKGFELLAASFAHICDLDDVKSDVGNGFSVLFPQADAGAPHSPSVLPIKHHSAHPTYHSHEPRTNLTYPLQLAGPYLLQPPQPSISAFQHQQHSARWDRDGISGAAFPNPHPHPISLGSRSPWRGVYLELRNGCSCKPPVHLCAQGQRPRQ